MYRWLPEGEGSDRDRVVEGFRKRMDEVANGGEDKQLKLGVALSLIWRDFVRQTGGLSAYAKEHHDKQKMLLVKLVKYEFSSRDEGHEAESIAAELLSYLIAMVAAHDDEGMEMMVRPIEQLARIGDPGIRLEEDGTG